MADPGYYYNQDFTMSTPKSWVKKWCWRDGGSQIHNYTFSTNIGIAAVNPRWPLQPNDAAGQLVFMSAAEIVTMISNDDNYNDYAGVVVNPQFAGHNEQVMEKNAVVMLPVGSEAVQFNDFVMPDCDTAFATAHLDVIPQRQLKQWVHHAHTAVTANVNLIVGYPVGSSQIIINTIAPVFALRPGMTINITKAADGLAYFYLIKDIAYIAGTAGAGAVITLAWPIVTTVLTNADAITTQHVAGDVIFFQHDSEFYENLHSIATCIQGDESAANADSLPVVAYVQAGIAVTTCAIVPSGAGTLHTHPGGARGGVGIQFGDALDTGDVVTLTAWFYDKLIRPKTVGKAVQSQATTRTSAILASETKVELKC